MHAYRDTTEMELHAKSMRASHHAKCSTKRRYRHKQDAKRALRRWRGDDKQQLIVYPCLCCGGFHLGHRRHQHHE